jgi:peroxiredoxin Q/BCP
MVKAIMGKMAPDFELPATSGQTIKLSELQGKNVILYFYPKDNTPGCTREAQDFRANLAPFEKSNSIIFGISRDSLKSHNNFKEKQCLPFELLSDETEKVCHLYDVIKTKNMYGKQVLGIERSTFLIDKNGILQREWRKVTVENHVAEVLAAVKSI